MIFKCKMCGGNLDITEGATTCECEYCGTNQTVPVIDNEKKLNLFNRANRLRMASEFDKAATVYENIVSEFPEESEGYWGLCLCKYGIEYVDDPATGKKIPTCHRTLYESIFDDNDFDMACEYADSSSKRLYRGEAKEIDRLQRAVLDIVKNEKPYDVFICYKETDESGQRTKDSVMAQDIYDALTDKGYKVFFARISLEDKLGQEYEPYIFAALTSAKVMLAIGTDYEYFNAVWVKNEWSRYLALMKNDKGKTLIPCYADIDAYDMPQEFKNLQAQDMNKIGFIQDLLRGIGKLIPLETNKPETAQPVQQVQTIVRSTNVENLIKRGNMAIEDGAFEDAKKHFERVLDEDAECAEAYWGLFLAAQKCNTDDIAEYLNKDTALFQNKELIKAVQFADESFLQYMKSYFDQAVTISENELDSTREKAYQVCKHNIEIGCVDDNTFDIIKTLDGYKDSGTLLEIAEEIKRKVEEWEKREKEIQQLNDRLSELNTKLDEYDSERTFCEKASKDMTFYMNNKSEFEKDVKEKEQRMTALNDELPSLGIFAAKRKKEISAELDILSSEIFKLNSDIKETERTISTLKISIDSHSRISDSEASSIQSEISQINARLTELQQ